MDFLNFDLAKFQFSLVQNTMTFDFLFFSCNGSNGRLIHFMLRCNFCDFGSFFILTDSGRASNKKLGVQTYFKGCKTPQKCKLLGYIAFLCDNFWNLGVQLHPLHPLARPLLMDDFKLLFNWQPFSFSFRSPL